MQAHDVFWNLAPLSDRQLLERMSSVLGSSRRLMAELIAQLGEVEERRLHLLAACSSMFAYCLKLGMTEDEAYRRIEVARLARRYPAIFPLLASGQLSISVVALLKHHLTVGNHLDLLAAATGRSVVQVRELIAARFPRPDIASSVRKLPERRTSAQSSLAPSTPTASRCDETASRCHETASRCHETAPTSPSHVHAPGPSETAPSSRSTMPRPSATAPRASSRIEPLSPHRYKVQLTASSELARKLELARDLMRHSHPDGELGPIVERAVDLLIESLMRQRFGKKAPKPERQGGGQREPEHSDDVECRASTTSDTAEPVATTVEPPRSDAPSVPADQRADSQRASASSHIPRAARRTVVERDGLSCSWVDEHGVRCGSRAWLEYDHRHPRAKRGGSEPDNLRLLCRHHNRFAAEREYGRRHMEQTIAERRRASAARATRDMTGRAERNRRECGPMANR